MSLLILPTEKKKNTEKRYPIQTKLQMYEGLDEQVLDLEMNVGTKPQDSTCVR